MLAELKNLISRRVLVRMHQVRRAFGARIDAALAEREMMMLHRQRTLEEQLREPGWIELRSDGRDFQDY